MLEAAEKVNSPCPVNLQVLAAVVGSDARLQRRLLARFRDAHPSDVHSLQQAFDTGDNSQMAAWAHRIKGASRMIGAMELGAVCERIESAAKSGAGTDVDQLHLDFLHESTRLTAFLAKLAGSGSNI